MPSSPAAAKRLAKVEAEKAAIAQARLTNREAARAAEQEAKTTKAEIEARRVSLEDRKYEIATEEAVIRIEKTEVERKKREIEIEKACVSAESEKLTTGLQETINTVIQEKAVLVAQIAELNRKKQESSVKRKAKKASYANTTRQCAVCTKDFQPLSFKALYCSKECYMLVARPAIKLNVPTVTIGAIAELAVCTELLAQGYSVFRHIVVNSFCDIVAIRIGSPIRLIEIKTGTVTKGTGRIEFKTDKNYPGATEFAVYIFETNTTHYFPTAGIADYSKYA